MTNGFLLPLFNLLVHVIHAINLVEYFKKAVCIFYRRAYSVKVLDKPKTIEASNIAIDIYQIFKFGILFVLWFIEMESELSKVIIFYLLASNLFTYFYYQVWGSKYESRTDRETLNRKFLNTIFAIAFYLLAYAYLYQFHYQEMICWLVNANALEAIYLSISTAFTLTYSGFSPKGDDITIYMVFMSEIINTFFFLTIIISNAVPKHS